MSLETESDPKQDDDNYCKIFQQNPWNVYLGDCAVVTSYLRDKPLLSLVWSPIHVINIFLRAVGQVSLQNISIFFIETKKS